MLRLTVCMGAALALAACGGGASETDAPDAEAEAGATEEAAEVELFDNGLPVYANFDEASLEVDETVLEEGRVQFETGDAIPDVFDFYHGWMTGEGLNPGSAAITGSPASGEGGANITADVRSAGTEVSVLIFDGSTNADPATHYTDGVPHFPGVTEADLTREKAGDGRRDVIRFTTQSSPDEVMTFYREAFGENGMEIGSMQARMTGVDSREYANVYVRDGMGGAQTAVTMTTKGDRWGVAGEQDGRGGGGPPRIPR